MKEKQIEKQIIEFLNYQDCWVWNNNSGMIPIKGKRGTRMIKVGKAGESDIFGIHKPTGRFISIEVKTPKRRTRVTQNQQEFINRVLDANGIAGVATSCEEALAIIRDQT